MEVIQAQLAILAQVSHEHGLGVAVMIQNCFEKLLEQFSTVLQVTWSLHLSVFP